MREKQYETVPFQHYYFGNAFYQSMTLITKRIPWGTVVMTLHFQYKGYGFNPWSGNEMHLLPCSTAKKYK